MDKESEVSEFYKGKRLFVTGGSGFMGKVLLEKLLYSCPGVEKIYVLLRSKKGKSPEARIEEMFKLPLFQRVVAERAGASAKVSAVEGDVTLPDLGLCPEDRKTLLEQTQIVVHAAASLRLEAPLKSAINANTGGTLRVLQLASDMQHLQLFVHVSTAFCHCDIEELEEKVYPAPYKAEDLVRLVGWLPDHILSRITKELLYPHPNAYTFSKRLAEQLISESSLPAIILRPSIVIPAWKEPLPGWVDNLNGPTGILVGGAKGVIRSMHCYPEYSAEVIPVDLAINGILAAVCRHANHREKEVPVVNLTQGKTYPIKWGEIVDRGKEIAWKYPFEIMLWYPDGTMYRSRMAHRVSTALFHWLPAYLIDSIMFVLGRKRFMVRIARRINDGLEVLQYFTTRQWIFKNEKLLQLRTSLSSVDRERFSLDFEKIDMENYLTNTVLGARHYLMKEDPDSIPRCRVILKILYILDKSASLVFYILLGWLLVSTSEAASSCLDASVAFISSTLPFFREVQHM